MVLCRVTAPQKIGNVIQKMLCGAASVGIEGVTNPMWGLFFLFVHAGVWWDPFNQTIVTVLQRKPIAVILF